jgi:hypothetical protein
VNIFKSQRTCPGKTRPMLTGRTMPLWSRYCVVKVLIRIKDGEVTTMAKHSRENGADLFAIPFALLCRRQKMVSEPYIVVDLD